MAISQKVVALLLEMILNDPPAGTVTVCQKSLVVPFVADAPLQAMGAEDGVNNAKSTVAVVETVQFAPGSFTAIGVASQGLLVAGQPVVLIETNITFEMALMPELMQVSTSL